jgi:cytochrome c-type biogenesis protein
MGGVVLSFVAGTLSVLSPCVLPLLPLVVASALQEHRHGPLALAAGLVLASATTGLFFASLGFTAGIDRDTARSAAAILMAAAGVTLLVPRLQAAVATTLAPVAGAADALTRRLPAGLGGQLLFGLLLGAVWTPCTGPTLAAAVTLAAQSETLPRAAVVMLGFGIGAVVPVLALAYGSRALLGRRTRWAALAATGKTLMGALLLLIGLLTVTGADKVIEAWMVEHMPAWLLELTTSV